MKEHSLAVSVSLLFHIIIVTFFLWVPFDQYVKQKLMALDFSIEKGRMIGNGQGEKVHSSKLKAQSQNQKPDLNSQQAQQEKQIAEKTIARQGDNIRRGAVEDPVMKRDSSDAVISDPAGQVKVRGETGSVGTQSANALEKKIPGGSSTRHLSALSGSERVIDYGRDNSGAKDFPFIASTISKRFKDRYPDRARRMGWEGEVLLSFIISENGTIRDIEITKGATRSIFNDDAREILSKITFKERLPYPLKVENWRVTYQLH